MEAMIMSPVTSKTEEVPNICSLFSVPVDILPFGFCQMTLSWTLATLSEVSLLASHSRNSWIVPPRLGRQESQGTQAATAEILRSWRMNQALWCGSQPRSRPNRWKRHG